MYLNGVLNDITRVRQTSSEHLYKLNEAIFNLPEEDTVNAALVKKLFDCVSKVRTDYSNGRLPSSDHAMYYDFLALLGTMQNQHFFSTKQTELLLAWIRELLDPSPAAPAPAAQKPEVNKADEKKLKKLEEDNDKLRAELKKYEELQSAVKVLNTYKAKGKGKGSGKGESKGKGKGESKDSGTEGAAGSGSKKRRRRGKTGKSGENAEA